MIDVLMNWQASTLHAWGILGLNVFMHLADDAELRPRMGHMMQDAYFPMLDPIRLQRLAPAANASNQYLQGLLSGTEYQRRNLQAVLVNSLGNSMLSSNDKFAAKIEIGRLVFESGVLENAQQHLSRYDRILCCSSWNAEIARASCSVPVELIFEGIDPSLYHPAPRSGFRAPDRFYVFSGGKLEYRKGQDIIVKAFQQFAARHSDAVLVTSWRSPWPQHSAGFSGVLEKPLKLDSNGQIAVTQWCVENGIPHNQVLDIGLVPNPMMPAVIREMDCTITASRSEGGTSLPSMESMACGVPVIIANNTGLRDLVSEGNCVPLMRQDAAEPNVDNPHTEGWGESSADEIVEALEMLYSDTEKRRRIAAEGERWMRTNNKTWAHYTAQFKQLILETASRAQ